MCCIYKVCVVVYVVVCIRWCCGAYVSVLWCMYKVCCDCEGVLCCMYKACAMVNLSDVSVW